jgi:diguanylate cyclase (GGDEF)-like protein
LIANHAFVAEGKEVRVTISIGAAAAGAMTTVEQIYKAADEKLYEAKRAGRNKVCY